MTTNIEWAPRSEYHWFFECKPPYLKIGLALTELSIRRRLSRT